jgi:predicted dehydrogenase
MKLVVVGTGSIGRRHASNARAFGDVGVFDVDIDRAKACAHELSVDCFPDLATAMDWGPDAVVVATPTQVRLAPIRAAVEAGAAILIEKPIAARMEEAEEIAELISHHRAIAAVGCNMRFHPGVRALRENIARIGRPLFAQAQFGNYLPNMRPSVDYRTLYVASKRAGDIILDCIHEIDYLMWLLGPVARANASGRKLSDLEIEAGDFAAVVLDHRGGSTSLVTLDYLRRCKQRGCEIVGDRGTLIWSSEGKDPEQCSVRLFEASTGQWTTLLSDHAIDTNAPFVAELDAFTRLVAGESSVMLNVGSAVEVLSVALAATAAAAGPLESR